MAADVTSAPSGESPVAPPSGDRFLRIVPAAPPVPMPPAPAEAQPPKRKIYVSRRTFEGLHPRPPKVPTTAEDSLALRAAVLKRHRKAAARKAHLLGQVKLILVPASVDVAPEAPADYEPMAPGIIYRADMPGGDA